MVDYQGVLFKGVMVYVNYSNRHVMYTTCVTGGIMAASWAILKCMGQDGYLDMARKLMAVTNYLKREINAMEVDNCNLYQ